MKKILSMLLVIGLLASNFAAPAPTYAASKMTGDTVDITDDVDYSGENTKSPVFFIDSASSTLLTEGTDFTAVWSNNNKPGTATVTITGKGKYTGKVTKNYTINQRNLNSCYIDGLKTDYSYTGKEVKPKIKVGVWSPLETEVFLKEGRDYTVEYKNNIKVGTATVTIKGKSPYTTGSNSLNFEISKAYFYDTKEKFTLSVQEEIAYNPSGKYNPKVTLKHNGNTLTEGKDYTVNIELPEKITYLPDNYYVIVRGKGNYEGELYGNGKIKAISITGATITPKQGNPMPNHSSYDSPYEDLDPTEFIVSLNGKNLVAYDDYLIKKVKKTKDKLIVKAVGMGLYGGETKQFEFTLKEGIEYVSLVNPYSWEKQASEIEIPVFIYQGKPVKPELTVLGTSDKAEKPVLKENVDYTVQYRNNTKVGIAEVVVKGKGKYIGEVVEQFKIINNPGNKRISGKSRYETGTKIADSLKSAKKIEKFPNIVVATGTNYPDALTGSYLAREKGAPIIITSPTELNSTVDYIKKNMEKSGTVYILGGAGAVPTSFENKLRSAGFKYKRLAGKSRYETNLKILNEIKYMSNLLIVVTGNNYPDALSASALNFPILLVGDKLTDEQIKFLKQKNFEYAEIIGGTGAVNESVKKELRKYTKDEVGRISGKNRYETSAKVASAFFYRSTSMILAIGTNFPDALTGGPLASFHNAPMILTSSNPKDYSYAKGYKKIAGTAIAIVLGGEKLISNQAVAEIMK